MPALRETAQVFAIKTWPSALLWQLTAAALARSEFDRSAKRRSDRDAD
jgi:hypothetical protein